MTKFAALPSAVVTALMALAFGGTPASAHPHVWVSMTAEIVYAPDGLVTGVRHAWTFDDAFSTFATMGIEAKKPGEFTREELKPLAQTNVESLKEYDYFTYARVNDARPKDLFGDPVDYWLAYEPKAGVLTLHFTLPLKAPVRAKTLDIEVYDPQFFIAFGFAAKSPMRLVGAPPQCKAAIVRSNGKNFPLSQRGSFTASDANAGMGAQFAEKISVKCP